MRRTIERERERERGRGGGGKGDDTCASSRRNATTASFFDSSFIRCCGGDFM